MWKYARLHVTELAFRALRVAESFDTVATMRKLKGYLTVPVAVALLGCAVGVPVGLAVAGSTSTGGESNASVQAAVASEASATEDAAAFDELRDKRRLALAHLVSRMKRWGDGGDAAEIARHEAEIADLGGVSAEEQSAIDHELDRTVTEQEYNAYLRANLSSEDYERMKRGLQPLNPPEDPEPLVP